MTRLTLRLDFPSGSWLGDVSRARPDATLRTTETVAAVEGDVTALTVTGTDRAETVEALRAHDRVDRIDIVDRTGPRRGSESSHPRRRRTSRPRERSGYRSRIRLR